MNKNRRKHSNPIEISRVARWLCGALVLAGVGFAFVFLKHQQYGLGEQMRQVERQLSEARAYNQVLAAQVATLTSRPALQQKLTEGFVQMMPIQDTRIARLTPPAIAMPDGVLRTASAGTSSGSVRQ